MAHVIASGCKMLHDFITNTKIYINIAKNIDNNI